MKKGLLLSLGLMFILALASGTWAMAALARSPAEPTRSAWEFTWQASPTSDVTPQAAFAAHAWAKSLDGVLEAPASVIWLMIGPRRAVAFVTLDPERIYVTSVVLDKDASSLRWIFVSGTTVGHGSQGAFQSARARALLTLPHDRYYLSESSISTAPACAEKMWVSSAQTFVLLTCAETVEPASPGTSIPASFGPSRVG